ncbi:6-pyruvoyl trahydropterin synthase family protein [Planctomyces sp. SH-PL14]|uniref:6-pyruvoyl trahydropterin synthase family protein n=1 Tax=Planctomyces sp. SH-PL14 TaxID=1632864 RepID=UPI00078D8D56|nr:6-carboxytetrahydropterin synthase [Planctomyces sp. SH-PL14]AMV22555.1 6-pyruvoyl tetrahydropterin synthase [Planctomyces sp. SH-PL14]
MADSYRVHVTKDHLVFSAGHFVTITTPDVSFCERLHGHNWRVSADVTGPLDVNRYVFDFVALRDTLQRIVADLDHRMLLPTRHPQIPLAVSDREVEARYGDRRWVFPLEECRLLPLEQTTAELLAGWIGERLLEQIGPHDLSEICIGVEENFGQWAFWSRKFAAPQ